MSAGEYCNREVVVVHKDEPLREAIKLMRSQHVGDVVVVEQRHEQTIPLGILTDRDIVVEILAKEVALIERLLRRAVAYDAAENLASAYGYYLDEFMWDAVADLFEQDGKRDLGSIAFEVGREKIRQSLKSRYPGTKSKTFFTVHQLVQPVIHVEADGHSANMRVRLFQLGGVSGGSGHWIAGMYETKLGKEDGVWKFKTLDLDYTWTADYRNGWANIADNTKGIINTPFPEITDLPFHYRNPVTGRSPSFYVP